MSDHLLTPDERQRFAAYCRANADAYDAIAKRLDKLPGMVPAIQMNRQFALAYAIVAKHLETAQDDES